MAGFRNDYSYLAHPRVLEALSRIGDEEQTPYGLDIHSKHAAELIKEQFGCPNADIHFVAGGTQANLVFLSGALKSYEGIISCVTGHINVHESAAIEGSGHKIFTLPCKDGKLSAEDIEKAMALNNDEHTVSLKAVYISNSTETGTIYTRAELNALGTVCDKYDLYLFLDGARLGSALTSPENDIEPSFIARMCDGFTIGGTKNGMMLGEALVIVRKELKKNFRNHIKNKGAMLAKGFLVGAEYEEMFKDGLYFDLAKKTNDLAFSLKDGLLKSGVDVYPSSTNQVFAKFKKDKALAIIDRFGCEKWEDLGEDLIIRFVISFKTTEEDVQSALSFIASL